MSKKTIYRVDQIHQPNNRTPGDSQVPVTLPLPTKRFPTPEYIERIRDGVILLLTAYECAHSVGRDIWDFAMEISSLRRTGLADNDLRWLTLKNYVVHAREVTSKEEDRRHFRPTGNLCFSKRTCFVLTEAGALFACRELNESSPPAPTDVLALSGQHNLEAAILPTWDADERELRIGRRLIKRFRRCAVNQERILDSFQEDGWPHRIDDPIPPKPDQNQRQRLRDAISSLNKHQEIELMRFRGDGTGRGIIWELTVGSREPRTGR